MKFNLWTNNGAMNSAPVFKAFEIGARKLGHDIVHNSTDGIDVIWSVLWHGRMAKNQEIWDKAQAQNKPIVVIEVGNIKRGTYWKVGVNGVNRDAYFAPTGFDGARKHILDLRAKTWKDNQEGDILLVTQHDKSEQWRNMPSMSTWVYNTIEELRSHTDRKITVRSHPRCRLTSLQFEFKNVQVQDPQKINGTYDDFDFNCKQSWAVVNWSSNPAIEAVMEGIPVFVGPSSLAYDVGNHNYSTIEHPLKPDRTQWLNDYAHIEHDITEIQEGIPIIYLTDYLNKTKM